MSFNCLKYKQFFVCLLFLFCNTLNAQDIELVVKEAFVDVHTGPSSLHPVFYVVTRNEKIKLLKQKTQWIKIEFNQQQGWVHQDDVKKTVYSNGDAFEFDEADFDDYIKRRVEIGILAGSIENSPSFSLTTGYLFNELFSAQLSVVKSIGQLSSISIVSVDAVMTPFPKIEYSPYFIMGVGQAKLTPRTTLINPKTTNSSTAKVAFGVKKYLGERFVMRLEFANYILLSADEDADSNEEVNEWKLGFSTFF